MRFLMVLLLVAPLLSGCASSGQPPEHMFATAEHRFADRTTGAFDETHQLELAEGVHTLRIAAQSNDGFAAYLQAPGEREPYSGVMFPGANNGIGHSGPVRITSLEFATVPGGAGTWTLSIGCADACAYTVAVDEGFHVPDQRAPTRGMVVGDLNAGQAEHKLQVGRSLVNITMHLADQEGMSVRIRDAEGNQVSGWNFNGVLARNWRHVNTHSEGVPGEWTVWVGCDGACSYAFDIR